MVAVARDLPPVGEERFLLTGVSWDHFLALVRNFERDGINTRLTYCEGDLELMSPGSLHEETKTLIARLLEGYAEERDLNLNGFGETLFKSKVVKRGGQPDECYGLGRLGKTPELAIEVVYSRPKLDKLDVYADWACPRCGSTAIRRSRSMSSRMGASSSARAASCCPSSTSSSCSPSFDPARIKRRW